MNEVTEVTREPKFKSGKEVIEKACQHFWDDTPEDTQNILTYFHEALDLMETWDDIQPENNISHDVCEKIKERVEKLVYDEYSTKAMYHRFDETIEWIGHAMFFHKIFHISDANKKFNEKVDTSTDICTPSEYWHWLDHLSYRIIDIIKEYGVEPYNRFRNCILRSKFHYVNRGIYARFYTRRRSLVRFKINAKWDVKYNGYAGKWQPIDSDRRIKDQFLDLIYDDTKSIYSGKPNGEPRLALAYPEYFREPDMVQRKEIKLENVRLDPQFTYISHTRTTVHIDYCENGIDIIYKENDDKIEHIEVGESFKIGNECRYWGLEKAGNKYYFRKYRNNGDVLNEVYIRTGDWLMAVTSGACRNGMFHPVNPFPIQVHFINHNLSDLIRESIPGWAKEIGSINGCTVYGDDTIPNGRSVYIKNRSKYYPLTVELYSEADTNEAQEQFEKDFDNGAWKNEKFSIYRCHLLIKDLR